MKEQKELGVGDFSKIPNGIGSVEHRMDLLFQGVVDGRISSSAGSRSCSTTPARMFGLYGARASSRREPTPTSWSTTRNGHTSIGYGKTHHMNMDHSAWEGFEIDGHVDTVLSRGAVVIDQGEYLGSKGHGRYLKRGLSQYLSRRRRACCGAATRDRRRPRMELGVVLQCNPPASRVVDLARQAENLGFDYVWTFDSHLLWEEPFVIYSQILAETRKVTVGPMVTNPATRDWTVTASLFATLNEMYGNRTVCGIGRGDSAVRVINGKPTTLATLRESDPRHPRARQRARGRAPGRRPCGSRGAADPARRVGRGVRARRRWRSPARSGTASSCSWPTLASPPGRSRRSGEAAEHAGRDPTRSRSASRPRRTSGRPGPHARPVPLVRRDGRQPRRRHRGAATATTGRCRAR